MIRMVRIIRGVDVRRVGSTSEWHTASGDSARWIKLTWDRPQRIRAVFLSDASHPDNNVTGYTIEFEDGTRLSGTNLPVRGAYRERSVSTGSVESTWVKVSITSHTGSNPGLGEVVVIAEDPAFKGHLTLGASVVERPETGHHSSHSPLGQDERLFDGVIDSASPNYVSVGDHRRFIVIDLGDTYMVDGLNVWRYYRDVRQYRDVVYQLSTVSNFNSDVTTVFNNDANNSTGQGAGSDPEYRESSGGKPVYFPPVRARYLRLWSNGNTRNNGNHYTEVEVYGMRNVAFGRSVSQSGDAEYDADSSKATDGNLRNGAWDIAPAENQTRYAQVDIGEPWNIDSLRVWHEARDDRRVRYKDVVFRLSTTADFSRDVTTVFNNDLDDSAGLGRGGDGEYDETETGKIVHFPPTRARYIRLYSHGNLYDVQNRLSEVMVGQGRYVSALPPLDLSGAPRKAREGNQFEYSFPEVVVPVGQAVTYRAEQSNGGPLPAWLSFDPATRTFSGTPRTDVVGSSYDIRVHVSARRVQSVEDSFSLRVHGKPRLTTAGSLDVGADATDVRVQIPEGSRDIRLVATDNDDPARLGLITMDTGGGDAPLFQLVDPAFRNSTGQFYATLRFRSTPDYEQPRDFGGDNTYLIVLWVSNPTRVHTSTYVLSIVVTDKVIPATPARPSLSAGTFNFTVSVPAPTDAGGPVERYYYRVRRRLSEATPNSEASWTGWTEGYVRGTNRRFTVDGTSGAYHEVQVRAWNTEGYSADWSAPASVTLKEFDGTQISMSVSTATLPEAGGTTTLTARRSRGDISLRFAWQVDVLSGAPEALEFSPTHRRVPFPTGVGVDSDVVLEGTAPVVITAVDDDIDQPDRVIILGGLAADHPDPTVPTHIGDQVLILPHNTVELTIVDDDTAGVRLTAPPVISLEEGMSERSSASYTVRLESEPTADVTLGVAPAAGLPVSASPATLTFTAEDWDEPQTVTLSAEDDADGRDANGTLTHTPTSVAVEYADIEVEDIEVVVTDDDLPGVSVPADIRVTEGAPPAGSTGGVPAGSIGGEPAGSTDDEPAGSTDDEPAGTYSVVLDTEPAGDVTVDLTSTAPVSVSPATLTFTAVDWYVPQKVAVYVKADNTAQGERVVQVDYTLTSEADTDYHARVVPATVVTVADDDVAALTFAPNALTVTEEAASATYTVALTSEPTTDVTLNVAPPPALTDVRAAPATLTFTSANWNTAQTVTVTAVHDDDAVDDTILLTHTASGAEFEGVSSTLVVTVEDDDTPALVLPESVSVTEGPGLGGPPVSVDISLASQPVGEVTVVPDKFQDRQGTAPEGLSYTPAQLTFTPEDWNTSQSMTLTAVGADDDADGETLTLVFALFGSPEYSALAPELTVRVRDPDTAGVIITPINLSLAEGREGTYEVVLSAAPMTGAEVTVSEYQVIGAIEGEDFSQMAKKNLSLDPSELTFDGESWNVPQVVTAHYANDNRVGIVLIDVGFSVSGDGGNYDNVTAPHLTITVIDNDSAGVVFSKQRLTLTEGTGSESYTVELTSRPSADVTLSITVPPDLPVSVIPVSATLTFKPDNWQTPQTVTLAAVRDADAVDSIGFVIQSLASTDLDYNRLFADSDSDWQVRLSQLRVHVRDADEARVILTPDRVALTEGDGNGADYTVALTSQPTADVMLRVTVPPDAPVSVSPGVLTFTPDNWKAPQTVTVVGEWDPDRDNETLTLGHTADGALEYRRPDLGAVEVAVTDVNRAPSAPVLADVSAIQGQLFNYRFSEVTDPEGDTLSYAATQEDGTALPAWLSFDPDRRLISGTPSRADVATLNIKVTVTDSDASEPMTSSAVFSLTVLEVFPLRVDPVTGDNVINITEKANGFTISGDTGPWPTPRSR